MFLFYIKKWNFEKTLFGNSDLTFYKKETLKLMVTPHYLRKGMWWVGTLISGRS